MQLVGLRAWKFQLEQAEKIWQGNGGRAKYDFISNCKQADCIYESRSAPAKCLEPPKARQLRNC